MRHLKKILLLVVLAATSVVSIGCETEELKTGRSDVVHIDNVFGQQGHSSETITSAEELLGLELNYESVPANHGVIMAFVDEPIGHLGGADVAVYCAPVIWSIDVDVYFAHEVGHALGLRHVDDPNNLMSEKVTGTELTNEQIDVMREWAWWLEVKCG